MAGILIVTTSSSLFRWTSAVLAPAGLAVAAHGSQFGIALAIADQTSEVVLIDADFPGLDVPLTCYLLKRWRPDVALVVLADRTVVPVEEAVLEAKADGIISTRMAPGDFTEAVLGFLQRQRDPSTTAGDPARAVARRP